MLYRHTHIYARAQPRAIETWLACVYIRVNVTHFVNMRHDAFIWDMTHMRHDSFIWDMVCSYETWPIHMRHDSSIWDMTHPYETWLIHMRHDSSIWEIFCGNEARLSCIYTRLYVNESCLIWMSHVSYEWVMSHMNESCLMWMGRVPISRVSYLWTSHVANDFGKEAHETRLIQMNTSRLVTMNESCRKWVVSHDESCRKWMLKSGVWLLKRGVWFIWISRVSQLRTSHVANDFWKEACLSCIYTCPQTKHGT